MYWTFFNFILYIMDCGSVVGVLEKHKLWRYGHKKCWEGTSSWIFIQWGIRNFNKRHTNCKSLTINHDDGIHLNAWSMHLWMHRLWSHIIKDMQNQRPLDMKYHSKSIPLLRDSHAPNSPCTCRTVTCWHPNHRFPILSTFKHGRVNFSDFHLSRASSCCCLSCTQVFSSVHMM